MPRKLEALKPEKANIGVKPSEYEYERMYKRLEAISPRDVLLDAITLRPPFVDAFEAKDGIYDVIAASIKKNGYNRKFPIFLWLKDSQHVLLDGHRRYLASKENSLDSIPAYVFSETDFRDDKDALNFIYEIQFGRRNIDEKSTLRFIMSLNLDTLPGPKGMKTKDKLSAICHFSHGTAQKYLTVISKGTPDLIAEIENGEISVNIAYNRLTGNSTSERPEKNAVATLESRTNEQDVASDIDLNTSNSTSPKEAQPLVEIQDPQKSEPLFVRKLYKELEKARKLRLSDDKKWENDGYIRGLSFALSMIEKNS